MESANGSVQNREAIKVAKKQVGDYQYKVNHIIELYQQHAHRNKAQVRLVVGKTRL